MFMPLSEPYPSRSESEISLIRRREPVVWSCPEKRPPWLDKDQVETYQRTGFLVLPGLLSAAEVKVLTDEMHGVLQRAKDWDGDQVIREPGGDAVRSVFSLPNVSEVFSRLARHPKLLSFAHYVLDDDVYLHQTRLNFKPGFQGKEFYWHSDFETWHVEDGMPAMRALSCSILLTENNEFNGPLMVVPGSHTIYVGCMGETPPDNYRKSLVSQHIGTPSDEVLSLLTDEAGGLASITGPAGTVAFFDCNLLHGSSGNITPYPRSNVFLVYNSVQNRLGDPLYGLAQRPEHIAHRFQSDALLPAEPTSH